MGHQIEERGATGAVVALSGRLDLSAAGSVRELFAGLIGQDRRRIVVDLGNVEFIDSSGLGALISGLKAARVAGGTLAIARPNDQARLVLELTTLDRVLVPHPTVEAALDQAGVG